MFIMELITARRERHVSVVEGSALPEMSLTAVRLRTECTK
jgi:hypothetical protein